MRICLVGNDSESAANVKKAMDGVTSIGSYAFAGCTSLSQITIPTSVSRIGTSAFYNCGELSVVWYGGSDEQWDEVSVGSGNDDLLYDTEICFNCVQKCGDDLTWTLKNGTLTISGNGDMYDYSWSSAPWYNESGSIVNVVIKDGVTSIGTYAFIECSNLKSVSIPASVTSIGDGAFEECWSLDEVHYSGTTENWSAITVGDNNGRLKLVDVVCSNGTILLILEHSLNTPYPIYSKPSGSVMLLRFIHSRNA